MGRAVGCKVCPRVKAGLLRLTSEHRFAYLWDEVLVGPFPLGLLRVMSFLEAGLLALFDPKMLQTWLFPCYVNTGSICKLREL